MTKRLIECCDQWDDLQTMAFANDIDVDAFKPMIMDCSSIDDFELKVKDCIDDKLCGYKDHFTELDTDDNSQLYILAALDNVNIDKLVSIVMDYLSPDLRLLRLESRVNKLYSLIVEKKSTNERGTTEPYEGELAAFDIATNFDKDELDIDSSVDVKNKKDAWILRLVYNDGNKENISMVKPDDNKDDYVMTSDKDKLKVKFSDDPDGTLNVPQTVIDHIAKHIEQAEKNTEDNKKNNDSDLAHEIAYDIKKEFPNYDMEVIEGDVGDKKWTIEIVYKNGKKDHFTINKVGKSYIMRSNDFFISKFTLDELKNFPKKLADHIKNHADKAEKK
jgi:hypothetical protein